MENGKDLDELWEMTEGTPECPKCGSVILYGHIKELKDGLATVEWSCEDCGHKWSNCCPFEDGVLTAVCARAKTKRHKCVFICPFDGLPCDTPVPRGFTACPDCPRYGKV